MATRNLNALKLFEIEPIVISKMKVKKEKQKVTRANNRRYKLHQRIKNICKLQSRQKLIQVPDGYQTNNKYLLELIQKFQYNLQYHIPIPNPSEIDVNEPEIVTN